MFSTAPGMKTDGRQSLQCLLDGVHQGAMQPSQAVGNVALPSGHLTDPSVFLSVVFEEEQCSRGLEAKPPLHNGLVWQC